MGSPLTWGTIRRDARHEGRSALPYALFHAVVELRLTDPTEIAKGLRDAWILPEWPGRALPANAWATIFALALPEDTYLHDDTPTPRDSLTPLPPLYRAASAGHEQGMSFTSNPARAHWFATRFATIGGPAHRVYRLDAAIASPEMVLGRFDGRGEDEWVLDASMFDVDALVEVPAAEWDALLT